MRNVIAVVDMMDRASPKRILYDLSLASIRQYAHKLAVPLIVVTHPKYSKQLPKVPHLEKLQGIEMLQFYDRVLTLDLDILINPDAPDIFQTYPDASLTYGYDEGHLQWVADDVALFESHYGIEFPVGQREPAKRLLNGGSMLWSQASLVVPRVFSPLTFHASFGGTAGEQSWVNTMLVKHEVPVGYLDQCWNYCIYSEGIELYNKRLDDAHFIHYAADGEWIGQQPKVQQIQDDARRWGITL